MSALTKANAVIALEQARQSLVIAIRHAKEKGVPEGEIREMLNMNHYGYTNFVEGRS